MVPFNDDPGAGNDNPDRKWCTGRATSICIQSSYKLEGKIPIGVLLVNKLRDSVKKVADHIDFQSELSAQAAADVDQAALQQLTALDTPVSGVLEQDIFYVNQIMKFGKLLAVFQDHPSDAEQDGGHRVHGAGDQGPRARREARIRKRAGAAQPGAGAGADGPIVVQFRQLDQRRPAEIRAQRDLDDRGILEKDAGK